jgi:phosphatidylethanolamine/phosphatidyl-N-methylethanolamine N-methyltransferase
MEQVAKKKQSPQAPENKILFLREFFRTPHKIGAIAPSGTALARQIVRIARVADSSVIVEYGAGTGSFTKEILKRKRRDASFLAIESNPCMVEILRQRFPDLTVLQNCVEETPRLLQQFRLVHADCIVSGLPWSSFSGDLQDRLLGATLQALRPGGTFATFAYPHGLLLPGGLRFRKKIKELFESVSISRVIWNNLPPAIIYQCTK